MRRLPPFPGLVAFDAVLRHGSVTRAAAELGLTQSAVSHRLRGLEDYFGAPLLERLNPGLRPTPAGERLARDVAPLLGTLAGLRERVAGERASRPFRIGVSNALFSWWLSPRLPDLAAAFPAVTIEVTTRDSNPWDGKPGTVPEETDLALLWVPREAQGSSRCEVAFPVETVFPVVAPVLRRSCPGPDWRRLPRLAKGHAADGIGNEWSWATWLGADGEHPPAMRFRDISGALQAAQDGNGIVLARSLLVADALRRRRLSRLVRVPEMRPSSKIQVARWSDQADTVAPAMARGSSRQRKRPSGGERSPRLRRRHPVVRRLPLERRP